MKRDKFNVTAKGYVIAPLSSVIAGLFWIGMVQAQTLDVLSPRRTAAQEERSSQQIQTRQAPLVELALEGPVNPDTYIVGPSDVMSVNMWMATPLNFLLTVTPEGTLIIPTVGEVRIADLALSEAKKKVVAEVKKKYLSADPTMTLVVPRQVSLTVTGEVALPGTYTLFATERVEKALQLANRNPERAGPLSPSSRNIRVKRRDGSVIRVDLNRFYATKDDRWNPFVREGDQIYVPRTERTKDVIATYGGVNSPGRIEFAEGDRILDAIELAYGFTRRAIVDSVAHTRLDISGREMVRQIVNIKEILDEKGENFLLQPGDRIVVKEQPDFREDYRVRVEGEVLFPGFYPITKDKTKLSEIIQRAGGFTEFAALQAGDVIRRSVQPWEIDLERIMSLRGTISPEDSASYLTETELRLRREIVNVDFERVFLQKDPTADVILRNDDVIHIPSLRNTIYVFGQVVSPGNVPYVSGQDAQYYIRKAGGFTDRARTGDVVVIKRATRQWLSLSDTKIEEGDYIWVPMHPYRTFGYYVAIVGQTASIVSVAISVVLLVIQLK